MQLLGGKDSLEKSMATHTSILAWGIPRTEEPGGLQSIGSPSQTQLKRLSTQIASMHINRGLELSGPFPDLQG